jgi:hypothetical protein
MKIRDGFVANSSATDYIVAYGILPQDANEKKKEWTDELESILLNSNGYIVKSDEKAFSLLLQKMKDFNFQILETEVECYETGEDGELLD